MVKTNTPKSGSADLCAAMDRWGDTVLRLALCHTQNKADAEDVFQTVFLKLYLRNPHFNGEKHVKAWLLRVTINCCKDLRKSAWVRNRGSFEGDIEQLHESESTPSTLQKAIDDLPEKQRVAIYLFYFEGYSTDEIAQIMSENSATVRSHLHRARLALKITLGGNDERIRVPQQL